MGKQEMGCLFSALTWMLPLKMLKICRVRRARRQIVHYLCSNSGNLPISCVWNNTPKITTAVAVLNLWRWSVGFCVFLAWTQLGPVERQWWPGGLANCSLSVSLRASRQKFSYPSSGRGKLTDRAHILVEGFLFFNPSPRSSSFPTFPNFAWHLYAQQCRLNWI